jgi:hypothetical protein
VSFLFPNVHPSVVPVTLIIKRYNMSNATITKDGLLAWIKQTEEAQKRFHMFYDLFSIDEFFSDDAYVSKCLASIAHNLQYPGDGNWHGLQPTTQADIQISEMARIIRKLLPHVPDDLKFKAKVQDYLVRKGLSGSVLRNEMESVDATE